MQKTGIFKKCIICNKEFFAQQFWIKQTGARYCSRKCGYKSREGKSTWNKGKKMPFIHRKMPQGFMPTMAFNKGHTPWNKGKIVEQTRNEKNGQWKGKDVGYYALHDWVKRRLGFPKKCEHCFTTEIRIYHWANKSGLYKRDLTDWLRLCVPCHKKYDLSR